MKKKVLIPVLAVALFVACGGTAVYAATKSHTVTYDLDGGTLTSKDKVETVRWIDDAQTPEAEKEHYVFKGWSDGNTVMTTIKHARNDVTLRAVYTPEVYTVTFKDGDKVISESNYAYGSGTADLSVFAKANSKNHPYEEFDTWKDEGGKSVKTLSAEDSGNKTLTASYKGKTYKITYNLYDGTAEGLPESYQYGTGVESFPDASKEGRIFDGWYSDEACTKQVTNIPADSHGDITLYADYHNAPVVQKTSRAGGTRSYGSGSSRSTASSGGSYDYSVGVTIPRLGYHVDNVGGSEAIDASNAICLQTYNLQYWAHESDGNFAAQDLTADDDHTGLYLKTREYLMLSDHAYQGLSGMGWKMVAGDKLYLNGVEYTYSGIYSVSADCFGDMGLGGLSSNNFRLQVRTCTEQSDEVDYFCFFY